VQLRAVVTVATVAGLGFCFMAQRAPSHSPRTSASAPHDTGAVAPQGDLITKAPAEGAKPARDLGLIQERLRDGAPGTYILHMLPEQGDTLARWPDRMNEPLRIWIQRDASIPDWNPMYSVVAEQVFGEWEAAGFPLRFDRMRDSAGADIKIVFVHRMPPEEEARRIGVARRFRDQDGWLVRAEVVIATHDRSGRPLAPETIAGTARHEVGHVLGLGHSPDPADVMYPESRTASISGRDRATLHLIYMLPPGPVK
jgi:hypothetical protein